MPAEVRSSLRRVHGAISVPHCCSLSDLRRQPPRYCHTTSSHVGSLRQSQGEHRPRETHLGHEPRHDQLLPPRRVDGRPDLGCDHACVERLSSVVTSGKMSLISLKIGSTGGKTGGGGAGAVRLLQMIQRGRARSIRRGMVCVVWQAAPGRLDGPAWQDQGSSMRTRRWTAHTEARRTEHCRSGIQRHVHHYCNLLQPALADGGNERIAGDRLDDSRKGT